MNLLFLFWHLSGKHQENSLNPSNINIRSLTPRPYKMQKVLKIAVFNTFYFYSKFIFNNNAGTYIYGYISIFIWMLPAIFLIIRYNNKLKFKKDKLFSRLVLNKSLIITITISLVYIIIMMIINHKGFWFNNEIIKI